MRRRKTAIFFLILGIGLSILAVALNVGWILLNLTEVVVLVLGIVFFALIITGLILNTIFLVREIRPKLAPLGAYAFLSERLMEFDATYLNAVDRRR